MYKELMGWCSCRRPVQLCECATGPRAEVVAELRRRLLRRQEKQREAEQKIKLQPDPRYDEVYWEGMEWLETL